MPRHFADRVSLRHGHAVTDSDMLQHFVCSTPPSEQMRAKRCVALIEPGCLTYCGEMNDAGDGDDEKADDD